MTDKEPLRADDLHALERSNEEIGVLNEIAAAINAERDFSKIFEAFAQQLGRLINYRAASLLILGEDGDFHSGLLIERKGEHVVVKELKYPPDYYRSKAGRRMTASRYVLERGETVIREDWTASDRFPVDQAALAEGVRSDILVPVLFRDEVTGLLTLTSAEPGTYSDRDLPVLQKLNTHLGTALANAQLVNALEAGNRQMGVLNEIAAAVSAERDFRKIFEVFAQQLGRLLDYHGTSLLVLGEDGLICSSLMIERGGGQLVITDYEYSPDHYRKNPDSRNSASQWALQRDEVVIREDWTKSNRFPFDQKAVAAGVRSDVLIPVSFRDEAIGVLTLTSKTPGAYSDRDLPPLRKLSRHLGPAVANARLVSVLEGSNKEISILNKIATAVNSERDLRQIFDVFVNEIAGLLDFDAVSLYVTGEGGLPYRGWLVECRDGTLVNHEVDLPDSYYEDHPYYVNGATYHVVAHDQPVIREDWNDPGPFTLDPSAIAGGIRSDILIPLRFRNKVVGLLTLASKRPNTYSDADLPLLRQLADQLGPVIHNTQLLTNLEEQNRRLEANRDELESKNSELERFAYTVSHDLKSPVVTIKGFLGLLEEDAVAGDLPRMQADIQHIVNASDQMSRLLDELLDLSRVGRLAGPPVDIHMGELVREAVEVVSGQIVERGVQVDIADEWSTVKGDRPRLLEVWQNLVDNAVKFMGRQTEPLVEIGQRTDGAEGVYYVRDNGLGIEQRHAEQIFDLFNRLDGDVEGTGIGLALVKRIVDVHGGRVWVESKGVGTGSTFCFTLGQKVGE